MKALVLGAAECMWRDLATVLAVSCVTDWTVFAVNDAAVHYPGHLHHFVTFHTEAKKLPVWMAERKRLGGNMGFTVWSREYPRDGGHVDRVLRGWGGGSSGLLAVGAAITEGADLVVCCGMPMDDRPHAFHDRAWPKVHIYRGGWERKLETMRGRVFSMSGWTRELLGYPPFLEMRKAA